MLLGLYMWIVRRTSFISIAYLQYAYFIMPYVGVHLTSVHG